MKMKLIVLPIHFLPFDEAGRNFQSQTVGQFLLNVYRTRIFFSSSKYEDNMFYKLAKSQPSNYIFFLGFYYVCGTTCEVKFLSHSA